MWKRYDPLSAGGGTCTFLNPHVLAQKGMVADE